MPPAAKKAPAKPQDHKPKAVKELPPGEFTHGDVTYKLPPPSDAMEKLPGKAFRDMLLEGDMGELKMGFMCLEASGAPQETIDALYEKPTPEVLQIVGAWMNSLDKSGATLPES